MCMFFGLKHPNFHSWVKCPGLLWGKQKKLIAQRVVATVFSDEISFDM